MILFWWDHYLRGSAEAHSAVEDLDCFSGIRFLAERVSEYYQILTV